MEALACIFSPPHYNGYFDGKGYAQGLCAKAYFER